MILSAVLFALLLGAFIFLVLPRGSTWRRTTSAVVFAVLLALIYGGSIELLGRPKPLRLEWRNAAEAKLIGASFREGEAIYLWLQPEGAAEPRAYVLPWSIETAQQLQDAMRAGEANGTGVRVSSLSPAEGEDGEAKFYAPPQPSLPPKEDGVGDPMVVPRPTAGSAPRP